MTRHLHTLRLTAALFLSLAASGVAAAAPAAAAQPMSVPPAGHQAVVSAAAGADVTWGVRTADNDRGTARQNFVYSVDPGTRIEDSLVVTNHDHAPLDLDVYAADGFTTQGGQLDLLPRGAESTFLGAWVQAGPGHIIVAPGASVDVPFTLDVPANATPGDYLGGVVTSLASAQAESGMMVDRRLGVRIQLRVGGELRPAMTVEALSVDYHPTLNPFGPGSADVSYTVRNTGNTRLSALQSIALSGPFGMLRGDIAGVDPVPDLLPGESWTVAAHGDAVIPLFWLTVDATLAPAGPAGLAQAPDPALFVTSTSLLAVPWAQLGLTALVAAAIWLTVVARRRTRSRQRHAEEARVQAAVDAALRERTPV